MKKRERGAGRRGKTSVAFIVGTLSVFLIFAALLYFAIISIDSADGADKTSPGAPESLVSLGAPRSQLELERMFSSMRDEYTENGKSILEPVTSSYKNSIIERIESGESPALSVEEILYIVSDSISAYEKYDIIRLGGEDITPIKDLAFTSKAYDESARMKARDILKIIAYRIFTVSAPDRIQEVEGGYIYYPTHREKSDYARSFFISSPDAFEMSGLVAYNTEEGRSVELYPTVKILDECASSVIAESPRALSDVEKSVLLSAGHDQSACRNLTPEYFYGKTAVRLVALSGRILIVDTDNGTAVDPVSKNERIVSVYCINEAIYFTTAYEGGSAVLKYESGKIERIENFTETYVGIYGDGEDAFIFATEKRDSKKYISLLVRTGEPIKKLEK